MTPEHWQKIDHLLQEVVTLPRVQRSAFLDRACVGDEASRSEVESLLLFRERAENFLEVPALDSVAGLLFEDQPQSWIGRSVGPYVIEGQLGSGGMGEVYLAHDSRLERKVAIKFLPLGLAADEQARRRLITEAKAAARLDHPNICAIHEVEEDSGHTFIVMQYVEGETLASKVRREPLRLPEALDVVIRVAEALDQAHSRGIIHRDIKPQNIMITSQGQVKVLDFGLAKLMGSEEVSSGKEQPQGLWSAQGLIVGTPAYMSPEQATGAPVDARSDIFSLGVVLYECVTGTAPFSGRTPVDVCDQVINVDPPPPSQITPSVPPKLDTVILKALAKDQEARYQSAADLLKDLHAVRSLLRGEDRMWHRPRIFAYASVMGLVLLSLLTLPVLWPETQYRPPPAADLWYRKGIAALRDGVYHQATKMLERAIYHDDGFALAHARLAEAYAELDYPDKARDEWTRVTQIAPDLSELPRQDELLLRAINLGLTREFQQATEVYRQLADQSPQSERPGAYFDLGRAYERNDQIEEAIRQYHKVAELAPEEAATFLRVGTLYGQQQQTDRALEALKKAEEIYNAQGNHEGLAEVRYQRSFLLSDHEEQLAELRQALDDARFIGNEHQQIRTMLQLSSVYCTSGHTAKAEEFATDALRLARARGAENLASQGLIGLGEAHRFRGGSEDFEAAENYFRLALDLAEGSGESRNKARGLVSLGRLLITLHRADEGLSYIDQALPFYEKGGYRREASRAYYEFGRANILKGGYDQALQAFDRCRQLAQEVDDSSLLALSYRGIGSVRAHQERYPEALEFYRRSYQISESQGNRFQMASKLTDLGDLLWRLGQYQEARGAFARALAIADQPGVDKKKRILSRVYLIEAQMLLSERRLSDAMVKGREAFAANARNEHAVEAQCVLGLAQVFSGAKRQGKRKCEVALDRATAANYSLLLPATLLVLAEARIESGDANGALSAALEAREWFERKDQRESGWRAYLVAARAKQAAGDVMAARECASRARDLLSSLRQVWGERAYEDYLARPDIGQYHNLLKDILAAIQ